MQLVGLRCPLKKAPPQHPYQRRKQSWTTVKAKTNSKPTQITKVQLEKISDISLTSQKKKMDIVADHPTVKFLIVQTGACDVVKQQSGVLKQDL